MVSSLQKCIALTHRGSRAVVHHKVEPQKVEGPSGLSAIQFLCSHKVLKVFVVCPNLGHLLCAL
jgi:hypothetical protein